MAMTFLQLVNRLREKCGITGGDLTTLQGVTGESRRCVNWINEEWMKIQLAKNDWQWMRSQASVATQAGKGTYAPSADFGLTDFGYWDRDLDFRNYPTATGNIAEIPMDLISYDTWRDRYLYGANRYVQTRPLEFAIGPDKSICVGPLPAAGYTITGDYYRIPTEMSADSDVPAIPSQYELIIIYAAMQRYGIYEAAPEVLSEGQTEYKRMAESLGIDQTPDLITAGSLA